jgi:hypothetical protein
MLREDTAREYATNSKTRFMASTALERREWNDESREKGRLAEAKKRRVVGKLPMTSNTYLVYQMRLSKDGVKVLSGEQAAVGGIGLLWDLGKR